LFAEFKNGGSDYGPQGRPDRGNTHDFEDKELGKVVPYGVYDIGANGRLCQPLESTTTPDNSPSTAFGSGSIGSAASAIPRSSA
jgi:hypothetical protein